MVSTKRQMSKPRRISATSRRFGHGKSRSHAVAIILTTFATSVSTSMNARSTTMLPGKRGRGGARRSTSCGQHGLTRLAVRCRGRNESLATLTIRFDASALSSRLESVRF
jgi:hypothetical protein